MKKTKKSQKKSEKGPAQKILEYFFIVRVHDEIKTSPDVTAPNFSKCLPLRSIVN